MISRSGELRHAADVVRVDLHHLFRRRLDAGHRDLQHLGRAVHQQPDQPLAQLRPPRCGCRRPISTSPRPSFRFRSMTGMIRPRRLITPLMNSGARGTWRDLGDADDLLHQPHVDAVLLAAEEEGRQVLGRLDRLLLLARRARRRRRCCGRGRPRLRRRREVPGVRSHEGSRKRPRLRASGRLATAAASARARMSSARPEEGSAMRARGSTARPWIRPGRRRTRSRMAPAGPAPR